MRRSKAAVPLGPDGFRGSSDTSSVQYPVAGHTGSIQSRGTGPNGRLFDICPVIQNPYGTTSLPNPVTHTSTTILSPKQSRVTTRSARPLQTSTTQPPTPTTSTPGKRHMCMLHSVAQTP